MRRIIYRIVSTFILGTAVFLLAFTLTGVVLSHPTVQSNILSQLQRILEKRMGTAVHIEQVDMALPSRLVLRGVNMVDDQGGPLIDINQIQLDIFSFSLWNWLRNPEGLNELYVRYVEMDAVDFFLVKREDSVMNIDFLKGGDSDSSKSPLALALRFPEVQLKNCRFHYEDRSHPEVGQFSPGTINFRNFSARGIYGTIRASFEPGFIQARVDNLTAVEERTGFRLESFHTLLVADHLGAEPQVEWRELDAQAEGSHIRGNWIFPNRYLDEVLDEWVDIPSTMYVNASTWDMRTLGYFMSDSVPVTGAFYLDGAISGTLKKMESELLTVRYQDSSRVNAWIQMHNLDDDFRPLTLDVRIQQASILPWHILEILPNLDLPYNWRSLGRVGLTGDFAGTTDDFVLDLDMDSRLGGVSTILRILPGAPENGIPITYSGFVKTQELAWNQLGISQQLSSDRLNLQAKIRGEGSDFQSLNTQLDAQIFNSSLWEREIDTLIGNVRVANRQLTGLVDLIDQEGKASVTTNLNLLDSPALYQVTGKVEGLSLQKYLNYQEDINMTGSLAVDLRGDSLENINGDVQMRNLMLERVSDSQRIYVPDLLFDAQDNTRKSKYIILRSDLLDADLQGSFTFKGAIGLANRLLYESRLFVENDTSKIRTYYEEKVPDDSRVSVRLGLATKDSINALFNFLEQPLQVAPGGLIVSRFQFGLSERATISFEIDSLKYQDFAFKGVDLNLDLLKYANRNSLLVVGGAECDTISIFPELFFRDLSFNLNGLDRVIGTDLIAFQGDSENKLQLKVETHFPQNGRMVSSIDSVFTYFLFQEDSLRIREWNTVTYFSSEERWLFEDFVVSGKRGILDIKGDISPDTSSRLDAGLRNFDLEHMAVLYPGRYLPDGMAQLSLSFEELMGEGKISVKGEVDSFGINAYPYGELDLSGNWNLKQGSVHFLTGLEREGDKLIEVEGSYDKEREASPLRVSLATESGFPLDFVSPFVEEQLYGLQGQVALESFSIQGPLDDIQVYGTGNFEDARIGVEYFQSDYRFDASITFDNNRIIFPRITLFDKYNHTADLHGNIYHKGLQEFEFDLQMDEIKNFLLIDTKEEDNDLYYGKLYLKNGIASITGNLDQLDIQAYVMSGGGTQLKIPISYDKELEMPDYIRFVGGTDTDDGPVKVETGLQGFELNVSVQATPDAVVELIFDEKVGDIIRMQGSGTINFKVNEAGDFSMLGTYEIQEGDYLFTARNVLNKKFQVKQGGTISWSGDPYQGQLKLQAFYPLYADIRDLIQADETRRIATNVLMDMSGSLLQPEIELSIELPSLREQEALSIASLLRTIQYDEQELNKQVFSLMVFNRFAPVGGFLDDNVANTGVTTSISELLSNQLNYWLSQALNDKVNVNVGTSNFQDVNLLISARLFDDRVRIERDGILIGQGNSGLEVGNIRIIIRLIRPEKSLERKGELVLEVFNRESLDLTQQFTIQRGLGLFYKRNFDSLKELLKKEKKEE